MAWAGDSAVAASGVGQKIFLDETATRLGFAQECVTEIISVPALIRAMHGRRSSPRVEKWGKFHKTEAGASAAMRKESRVEINLAALIWCF